MAYLRNRYRGWRYPLHRRRSFRRRCEFHLRRRVRDPAPLPRKTRDSIPSPRRKHLEAFTLTTQHTKIETLSNRSVLPTDVFPTHVRSLMSDRGEVEKKLRLTRDQ